jgi:large subunit ribosomal protein L3
MPETKTKTKNSQSTRDGSADIPFLLGRKRGMTQIFTDDGQRHGVTVVAAGPMTVTQLKTEETDGYEAVQFGFGQTSGKNMSAAEKGHQKEASSGSYFETLVEYQPAESTGLAVGDQVDVSGFRVGDVVCEGTELCAPCSY